MVLTGILSLFAFSEVVQASVQFRLEKGGDAVEVTLTGATDFSAPFGNGVIAIGDLVWLEDGEGPVVNLGVGGLLPAHEPNYANFYSNNGNPDYFNVVATNFSSFISTWQDFMDYGAGGANTLEIRELKLNHAPLIDDSFGWTVYAIPEPSTFALLALGVLALGIKNRRAAAPFRPALGARFSPL